MVMLRTSFGSPFGRKARIAVSVLGLDGKVKVEPASTQDDSDLLPQQNPLGKVPVLILDDGILIVYEGRYRPPEMAVKGWLDRQSGKIARALISLEGTSQSLDSP